MTGDIRAIEWRFFGLGVLIGSVTALAAAERVPLLPAIGMTAEYGALLLPIGMTATFSALLVSIAMPERVRHRAPMRFGRLLWVFLLSAVVASLPLVLLLALARSINLGSFGVSVFSMIMAVVFLVCAPLHAVWISGLAERQTT